MMNNNDNKDIKFTGDPVAFDGVEGKRDPKTGKGRFDLIPEEVFGPLFDRVYELETTEPYTVDCTPASILNDIANEHMLDAIIKITILKYYNTDSAIDAMCCQIEAGAFLECCWNMFLDLAIHFQKGAEHYGERNCQKGIPKWSFKDSAMRHASQTFAGKTDEPHTILVVWNCWLFVWSEIHEKVNKGLSFLGMRLRTPEEIEAAKSAASTPEFKTNKLQAALKEVREAGYLVIQPTADLDTNYLINFVSELFTKKRKALKTSMFQHTKGSPEYDVFDKEQKRLKSFINAISTTSDDAETKTDDTKGDLEEMRSFIDNLKKWVEKQEFPIVTAIQHFYTREEVEAIKKEAAEKAIEDFLKDKENIERAICEFGSVNIIDKLEEMPLDKQRVFHKQFVDLMETSEGKERAMAWYSPTYLFNELIERVAEKQGQHDYHDFVPLLLQLNSTYAEFLANDKTKE